jgi:alcohol dehydrogenase (cytochrome c)
MERSQEAPSGEAEIMPTSHLTRDRARKLITLGCAGLASVSVAAQFASAPAAEYKLTVNKDRLINAQNEPQNWLMMNGDYASTRYSKLTQINRDNVKNLRLAWALALGGMQDVGQNGPENEVNPLIDNGFMYSSDGWGTVYKIDARNPNKGEFVWVSDSGVRHEGNVPRTRGIALWEDLVIANLPDGRVIAINRDSGEIVWDKKVAIANEFGSQEKFLTAPLVAEGKVIVANGAGDGGTRGWLAALDAKTGNELWRWYVVPKPGDPGSETWKDSNNAWKTGGGGLWQTGSYDPATRLTIWGTGNPVPIYDPQSRPGDNLYTNSAVALDIDTGKLVWYFQYTPNDSWDYDEIGVHMLYDTVINGENRKVVGHFGRNGFFYALDRGNGSFIKGAQYVNDLNWTKGLDPKTGKPIEYDPKLDVQTYVPEARALRGDSMKRACPTWHGGVAHQPTAYNPIKHIAYGVGAEGCFSQNGAKVAYKSPNGGMDAKASEKRTFTSDLYYGAITAYDTVNNKILAKAITDIEIRSGALVTAGGVVFTALQDGWVIAYNDETLEELWRFNLGTPLKGSPVTYAIGPKQYLAVQTSGRHLHPIKYDNLENSSYLFVFALN